jgi:recombination protein RecA
VREEERRRAIREKLARMAPAPADVIPTGFRELDEATGGLPRGRIAELSGAPGSGKTTLALRAIAALQGRGGSAAWIDADHTFDAAYAAALGVAIEALPVAQPESAEQAFEMALRLALSRAVDLVVIDSAAALTPEIELRMGIGQGGHGAHSRAMASGLRKLAGALRSSGAAALFLNQTRGSEESETTAGGAPLKLFATARVSLRAAGKGRTRFRVLKNKAAEPFREGDLRWENGPEPSECP